MAGMVPFAWDDPFNLDAELTEEERMIRDAAHAFAQGELQPRVIENFSKEVDDPELFPMMGEAGLLGATVPEEYGGAGASYVAYGLIAREIERVDSRPGMPAMAVSTAKLTRCSASSGEYPGAWVLICTCTFVMSGTASIGSR